jgi:uncharacterized protein involved in exopolysaccharide biosynthesis
MPPSPSLAQQLRTLWAAKTLIIAMGLGMAVVAGVIAWLLPKQFEATVLMMPVSDNGGRGQLGGLGAMASQFGGLASLAGLSLGDSGRKAEAVAVLQSEALTEQYVRDNNLLPVLFAKKWNASTGTWIDQRPGKIPTPWLANQLFKQSVRNVTPNAKTGLVSLTITWTDPAVATRWANGLVQLANEYLRSKAIRESERNVAFLNDEAAKTGVVEVRQAIYSILESEINKEMLARGTDEYALKVLDPAVQPERAARPLKALWILVGGLIGLLLSAGSVLVRAALAHGNTPGPND